MKFTPEKGRISVSAHEIRADDTSSLVQIRVRDSGKGISREFLGRLFDPFAQEENELTRGNEGVGLGLHMASYIIKAMGGSILVSTEPGKGSCFTVALPLRLVPHQPPAQAPAPSEEPDPPHFRDKHILVVDDNMINREVMTEMIGALEATVHSAENGRIALDLVRARPDYYDMVLMDIQMPVMDGLTATARIRDLPCDVPIIAVTASSLREDLETYRQAGMNDHVAKPVDMTTLTRSMARCLTGHHDQPVQADL